MVFSRSLAREAMEASMVREWVEAAGFVLVIAACYMLVIPV
jgi:hypothetical protein